MQEDTPSAGGAAERATRCSSEENVQAPAGGEPPVPPAAESPFVREAVEAPSPDGVPAGDQPAEFPFAEPPAGQSAEVSVESAGPDLVPPAESSGVEEVMTAGDMPPGETAWTPEELLPSTGEEAGESRDEQEFRALIEAIVYVTEEPVTAAQLAAALSRPKELVQQALAALAAEYERPEHGIAVREVAGGYKMTTKPEHHEAVRAFAKSLKPPLKLSLAALETLAVIAYKQPVTTPEIMEIRGVQGAGVLKTLLDRKLIVAAGRKNVIGKPVLYKTTREFLMQFGLKDLAELPTLKEFEEIRRLSLPETAGEAGVAAVADAEAVPEPAPPAEPPPDETHG